MRCYVLGAGCKVRCCVLRGIAGVAAHREFGQFLVIARGSLMETQNHLQDGADRGHISRQELESLLALSSHALAATTALLRYLQQHPTPGTRATQGR